MSRYHATTLRRRGLPGFVLLGAVILLCANVQMLGETSGLVLQVVQAHLDPHTLAVDVELANRGTRTVAAYGITIVTHYANGTKTTTHTIMDISNALVSASVFGSDPALKSSSKPFRAGDRRHYRAFAAPGETGSPAVSADAFVTTEVFVDGTAQGPAQEINRIRQIWKQELDETRRWLPDLIQLRSSRSSAENIRRTLIKLDAADGEPGAHDAGSAVRSTLKRNLTALAAEKNGISAPNDTGATKLVEVAEARATLLSHMLGEDRKGGKQ